MLNENNRINTINQYKHQNIILLDTIKNTDTYIHLKILDNLPSKFHTLMNKLITNNGPWLDTWKRMRLLKPEFNSNCKNCNNDIPQTLKHILLDCTDFETIRSDTR
ncbi:hypothetical protein DICPUDRAFT_79421 [Dictyostelium purpureum]|uniref:Uncharacterized protein n=1 Tax=Dictyostelium purpureum TaxID=5786 RepID=F0ZMJ5_DICPU|nr:uncharacterized protein DICPUDRAFT_79421 [Dictyostelium purpureum]EGC34836.1 hypothetical protein DICPUDRAFT_79421 [Dictyostelium purpureum]|eukprot:XP_003288643.1 hypothetical protein DICPUDRAFT_79421 [Dictyostelium purpureum]